jgi:hypothetical protein
MTNILILSLTLVGNKTHIAYTAPVGVYEVQYNKVEPSQSMTNGVWQTLPVKSTNNITEVKVISFDSVKSDEISFRLHKID